jgi:uncharacterized oligopeptide transporter (OPT) family protein
MLNPGAELNVAQVIAVVLGGVILGLIFTALIRKYFVVDKELPYPMGRAAAETLIIGDKGGKKFIALFTSLGLAGLFTFIRDAIPLIFPGKVIVPATFYNGRMMSYGSFGGIWLSPMLVGMGYIVGPVAVGVWFAGALIGDFGVLIGGVKLGLWDGVLASAIKSSLGIGLMVGAGIGIIIKGILPNAKAMIVSMFRKSAMSGSFISLRWTPVAIVILAAVFTTLCGMGVVASIVTILGVWLAASMSAQVVGQSGINPMEIFGIIVLLAVKAVSAVGQTEAFFVAAIVAIACGLAGDVMNDFKAGHILKSDPKAQWLGECIGGLVGAFVAVGIFYAIISAYGPEAFGDPELFLAPQAGAVAAMAGAIPHTLSFIIGLAAGCVLYCVNLPVMTLGLGVYLPFYLSMTAFAGGVLKLLSRKFAPDWDGKGFGLVIASGFLGGEGVVGVMIALCQAAAGFAGM